MGTILRTADAFEADGLILLEGCADLYNPKTVRASMGSGVPAAVPGVVRWQSCCRF